LVDRVEEWVSIRLRMIVICRSGLRRGLLKALLKVEKLAVVEALEILALSHETGERSCPALGNDLNNASF
jgi:hypothetical protein